METVQRLVTGKAGEWVGHRTFRMVKIPYVSLAWWAHGKDPLSKSTESTTPSVNPNVSDELWVTMTYQCSFD